MAGNKKDVAADTAPDEDVHMDAGGDEAAQAKTEAAAAGESVSWDAGSLRRTNSKRKRRNRNRRRRYRVRLYRNIKKTWSKKYSKL